jgi:hypothetical protein
MDDPPDEFEMVLAEVYGVWHHIAQKCDDSDKRSRKLEIHY